MTTTTVYLLLIEITVLIGAVTSLLVHRAGNSPGAVMSGKFGRQASKRESNLTLHELEELKELPLVPWGWPNCRPKSPRRIGKPDVSEAMYALMECIMMEKRLITEGDLHLEHTGMFGSQVNSAPGTNTQAERPASAQKELQAANDESIDIIDVFGRSKNVLKYGRQGTVASKQAVFRKNDTDLNFRQFEKKEILQPWGW